jgi:ribosomal protein S18 acetylase RimI-like enzyme
MTVRPATEFDHAAVQALAGELVAGAAPWRPADGVARAAAVWVADACRTGTDADHALLVACDRDGALLGFAAVGVRRHSSGDRDAHLSELVVAPGARRRGVGSRLVVACEDWALSRGLTRLSLETGAANEPARGLYARLGYAAEQVTLTRALA